MPRLVRNDDSPGALGRIERVAGALIGDENRFAREARIEFDESEDRGLAIGSNGANPRCRSLPPRGLGRRNARALENAPERYAGDSYRVR